jgi:hypothetical protein
MLPLTAAFVLPPDVENANALPVMRVRGEAR